MSRAIALEQYMVDPKTLSYDTLVHVPGGVTELQERSGPEPSVIAAGDSNNLIRI
jgi:hypothetical protein